jgi:hypothetical protein
MLKKSTIWTVLIVLGACCVADAGVRVRGHFRRNGSYVRSHVRTRPDGNFYNNWSTSPNINPYTGTTGTRYVPRYRSFSRPVYRSYQTPSFGSGFRSIWSW